MFRLDNINSVYMVCCIIMDFSRAGKRGLGLDRRSSPARRTPAARPAAPGCPNGKRTALMGNPLLVAKSGFAGLSLFRPPACGIAGQRTLSTPMHDGGTCACTLNLLPYIQMLNRETIAITQINKQAPIGVFFEKLPVFMIRSFIEISNNGFPIFFTFHDSLFPESVNFYESSRNLIPETGS